MAYKRKYKIEKAIARKVQTQAQAISLPSVGSAAHARGTGEGEPTLSARRLRQGSSTHLLPHLCNEGAFSKFAHPVPKLCNLSLARNEQSF